MRLRAYEKYMCKFLSILGKLHVSRLYMVMIKKHKADVQEQYTEMINLKNHKNADEFISKQ